MTGTLIFVESRTCKANMVRSAFALRAKDGLALSAAYTEIVEVTPSLRGQGLSIRIHFCHGVGDLLHGSRLQADHHIAALVGAHKGHTVLLNERHESRLEIRVEVCRSQNRLHISCLQLINAACHRTRHTRGLLLANSI